MAKRIPKLRSLLRRLHACESRTAKYKGLTMEQAWEIAYRLDRGWLQWKLRNCGGRYCKDAMHAEINKLMKDHPEARIRSLKRPLPPALLARFGGYEKAKPKANPKVKPLISR